MSVSTLEEKLEKVAGFNNDATNLQQLRKEHAQLRLLLQERSLELEERDAVLAKARNAIEQLRSEVTKLRDGQSDDDSGDAAAIERERDELAREKVDLQAALQTAQKSARAAGVAAAGDMRRMLDKEVKHRLAEQADGFQVKLRNASENAEAYRTEIETCRIKLERSSAEVVSLTDQLLREREETRKKAEMYRRAADVKADLERQIRTLTQAAAAVAAELESARRESRDKEGSVRRAQLKLAEEAGRMAEEAQWMETLRKEAELLRARQAADATQAAQLCVALEDARSMADATRRDAEKAAANHAVEIQATQLEVKEAKQTVDASKALEVQIVARLKEEEKKVHELRVTIETVRKQSNADLEAATAEIDKLRNEKTALQKAIDGLATGMQHLGDGPGSLGSSSVLSGPAAAAMAAVTDARKHLAETQSKLKENEAHYRGEVEQLKAELQAAKVDVETLSRIVNDTKAELQAEKVHAESIKQGAESANREAKAAQTRLSDEAKAVQKRLSEEAQVLQTRLSHDLHELKKELATKRTEWSDLMEVQGDTNEKLMRASLELENTRRWLDDVTKANASQIRESAAHVKALKEEHTAQVEELNRKNAIVISEMTGRVEDLKNEHAVRLRDTEARADRIESLKNEVEKQRREEMQKSDERRMVMEDATTKLRERLSEATTAAESDRYACERAQKEAAEARIRTKECEVARNRAQYDADRSRAEVEALKHAANSAASTLHQLLTSLPLHVDGVLEGLIDQQEQNPSPSGVPLANRREKRRGVPAGFGHGGDQNWSTKTPMVADTGGASEGLPEVSIDRIATFTSENLLVSLRRLIGIRQHFQKAVVEATYRREGQEVVANKALQELEARLASLARDASKLNTTAGVKVSEEVAAAREDARGRVEAMRVKLVQIEAAGRDAAREAEAEAEKAEALAAKLGDADNSIAKLRDDLREARETRHELEEAVRTAEESLLEAEAVSRDRAASLEKEINAAALRERNAREDYNRREAALQDEVMQNKKRALQAESEISAEIEENNQNTSKMKQALAKSEAERKDSELKCKDLEHQLEASRKELELLTRSLRTSSVNGSGSVLGVDMPSGAEHGSFVVNAEKLRMQSMAQQQQRQLKGDFESRMRHAAGQINQLTLQLSEVQAHAQQTMDKLQRAQDERHQLQFDVESARAQGRQARAEINQLQMKMQHLQQQNQVYGQEQECERQRQQPRTDGNGQCTNPVSSPITGASIQHACRRGGLHPNVAKLKEIERSLEDAGKRTSAMLVAIMELQGGNNWQAPPPAPVGTHQAPFSLSVAADGLTRTGDSPAIVDATAAVTRAATAAESWTIREQEVAKKSRICQRITGELNQLVGETRGLLALAKDHIASAAVELQRTGAPHGLELSGPISGGSDRDQASSQNAPSGSATTNARQIVRPCGTPSNFVTNIYPSSNLATKVIPKTPNIGIPRTRPRLGAQMNTPTHPVAASEATSQLSPSPSIRPLRSKQVQPTVLNAIGASISRLADRLK